VKDLTTDARGEAVWAITGAPGWSTFPFRAAFEARKSAAS